MDMEIADRELFLKYALPCANTLVKRGAVTQDLVDQLIAAVSEHKTIPEGSEKIFKVALPICELMARKMKKDRIDVEVIRKYFLLEHSRIVDLRHKAMKDFDPMMCKTHMGKVIDVRKDVAIVETKIGKLNCRIDFAPDVRIGERVVVHNKFIVEKINEDIEKLIADE